MDTSAKVISLKVKTERKLEGEIEALISTVAFNLLEEHHHDLSEGVSSELIEAFSGLKADLNKAIRSHLEEHRLGVEEIIREEKAKEKK